MYIISSKSSLAPPPFIEMSLLTNEWLWVCVLENCIDVASIFRIFFYWTLELLWCALFFILFVNWRFTVTANVCLVFDLTM